VTLFSVWNSSYWGSRCTHRLIQQHSQPNSSSFSLVGGRVSFLLLMQNQSGLNNRWSSFAEIDKRTELDCENRPLYTQVHWKVPKKSCDLCHAQDVIS